MIWVQLYQLSPVSAHTVALKAVIRKINIICSRYYALAFCSLQDVNCHAGQCPGYGAELYLHQVQLYRIGCLESGFVLVKV